MLKLLMTAVLMMAAATLSPAGAQTVPAATTAIATFGSGCFWCTEADFDKVPGVRGTVSGFMGGSSRNPTYEQVVSGRTGHAEVLQVTYDPTKVTYERLLEVYWRNVDPFDANGQFCDKGSQYRPVIFAHSPAQRAAAEASKAATAKALNGRFKDPIVVKIEDAGPFTAAEAYHQNFHTTNPVRYRLYRTGCGRDERLRQIWGG